MVSTVAVEEGEILQLFRDYLQENGHNECLASFEKTTNTVPLGLPSELCWLRELVLGGSWEGVLFFLKALNNTGDKKGCNECHLEVVKQQYLEVIESHSSNGTATPGPNTAENDRMQLIMQLLQELEQLCPTKDSYKSLCSLVTLPSLSASQEYNNWNKYTSRLECFYTVGRWVSGLLYPDMEFKVPPSLQSLHERVSVSNRLTQLVCKGLLFEKCESMCAQRCGETEVQSGTAEIFDLCSWIQHQPDSAFQVTPLKIQLVIIPELGRSEDTGSSLETHYHISRSVSITGNEGKASLKQPLTSQSVPELQAMLDAPNKRLVGSPPLQLKQSLWQPKPSLEVEHTDSGHAAGSGNTDPTTNKSTSIQQQKQDTQEDNVVLQAMAAEENDQKSTADGLNFSSDFTPSVKSHHKPRLGRDSSTPKPVGMRSKLTLQSSPVTSPVQCVTNTPQRSFQPQQSEQQQQLVAPPPRTGAKKFIDFDLSSQNQSVQLPSVTMLCKVTDTQVVRSVAFSESGSVVAIGANSKTLRVCLTDTLLQRTPSNEELPVYYHHPRYHRGSIYCMTWFEDSLLASGSNDQIIRLLSYNSELPEDCCRTQGHLNIHNGTIRDMVFTDSAKLASGGAGDPVIKLTDCHTKKTVSVYSGHTDQILTLVVVQHNVIASGSQDKTIKLWDLRQKSSFNTVELPGAALSLTATHNRLASSHLDGSCSIHDLFSLKPLATYNAHTGECRTLRFSPNGGQWLLSGSYDGSVCMCDTGSLEWQQVSQHNDKVVQCRWHCRGDVFATTGADKMACFWMLNDS